MTAKHASKNPSRLMGLPVGILFGFLLQKGGVTQYEVLIGQLLLKDFTVMKIILSAIAFTVLALSVLYPMGKVELHPKGGSIKNATLGGLLFGAGFALLGYCPGTLAGAIGQGSLDALFGGLPGIIIGSMLFAKLYPAMTERKILTEDRFSEVSLFQRMRGHPLPRVLPFVFLLVLVLYLVEQFL